MICQNFSINDLCMLSEVNTYNLKVLSLTRVSVGMNPLLEILLTLFASDIFCKDV